MIRGLTPRLYQETIVATAALHNTLVVLPTGLGKTLIAVMLAVIRLKDHPHSKIVMVSPTKPLVNQHFQTFKDHVEIPESEMVVFTGDVSPQKRKALWDQASIVFTTPQGFENDLIGAKLALEDVSLLIVDEAHRTVGDYSYVLIAKQYLRRAKFARILGLTASPGAEKDKILEVCKNLDIERVEIRTPEDPDVAPYVQETQVSYVEVDFPPELKRLKNYLDECERSKLVAVKGLGYLSSLDVSKTQLLALQGQLHSEIARGERDFAVMKSISLLAEAMKVQHATELLETQGLSQTAKYLEKIEAEAATSKVKAVQNLVRDLLFRQALHCARQLSEKNIEHPKLDRLRKLINDHAKPDAKIIIFTQYRDSADQIKETLDQQGVQSRIFVGQQKKEGRGMSQKEQLEAINEFKLGLFQVLICTSVAEEGLDIPRVDVVVFFEPVPSAIRTIQRRGRTGRQEEGKVFTLVTKGTRDVAYRWSAHHKEKQMHRILAELRRSIPLDLGKKEHKVSDPAQANLNSFAQDKLRIIADHREKGSAVIKNLIDAQVEIGLEQLNAADFILSERVAVEYKTVEDFVLSIIDGRLLEQAKSLKRSFSRPIIIIEGEQDIYSVRQVHPNAILGMLAALTVSFGIPVLRTKDAQETSMLLQVMAKRERELSHGSVDWHGAKRDFSVKDQMEYVTAALPGVGLTLARPLLKQFKTLRKLFLSSLDELKTVEQIGPQKAKKITDLLDADYHEESQK